MDKTEKDIDRALALFRQTYPMFKGVGADVIGNVLAKLAAGWLMGYKSKDKESTDLLRLEILMSFTKGIIDLVEDLRENNTDKLH